MRSRRRLLILPLQAAILMLPKMAHSAEEKSHLMLSYANTGGARISLNGFLLVNDLVGESGSLRVEPYAVPGTNLLRIETLLTRDAQATVQIALVSGAGGTVTQLLSQVTHPGATRPVSSTQTTFELPAHLPRWNWVGAQPAPAGSERLIPDALARLATALMRGPDDVLLQLLALKHSETGTALGIGKERMDRGLLHSLGVRRGHPEFRVEVAAPEDLDLAWSSDRRIVRALRRDGRDAIQLRHEGAWSGFAVSLAFGTGQWWVQR
jgi:hypothetical protein